MTQTGSGTGTAASGAATAAVYATAAELRTQMDKDGTTGSGSAANLDIILEGVSRGIDRMFNRPAGWFTALATAAARLFPGSGKAHQRIDECIAITLVEVKDSVSDDDYTEWEATDWIAFSGDPRFPNFNDLPYTGLIVDPTGDQSLFTGGLFSGLKGFRPIEPAGRMVPTVRVTAKWGYAEECPPLIKSATLALAARWFKQGQGAWADTLASADFGGLIYRAQNADIRMMLKETRYWRPAMG
jgi:hypothetical protein